jgi:hypothetical protein
MNQRAGDAQSFARKSDDDQAGTRAGQPYRNVYLRPSASLTTARSASPKSICGFSCSIDVVIATPVSHACVWQFGHKTREAGTFFGR